MNDGAAGETTDDTAHAARADGPDAAAGEPETDKYAQYRQTVLEFCDGGPRIDLRRSLEDADRAALAALGLDREFSVLTAENPHGENEQDAEDPAEERARERRNDRRTRGLVEELRDAGLAFARVDGVAPDGSYRERCVAVPGGREVGQRLAREWAQLALFWFDGEAFWLLPAEASAPPQRLP
jgi:hypothetical protein